MKTQVATKFVAVGAFVVMFGSSLISCRSMYPTEPREQSGVTAVHGRSVHEGGSVRSQAEVFTAATDIRDALEAYRTALGPQNPNNPGSVGSGPMPKN